MLAYFYGPDTFGARQAIDKIAKKEQARLRWLDRHDFEERLPADVVGQGSAGLFGRDLLVIRDVGSMPKGVQQDVLGALEAAGAAVDCVLWDREKVDRRSALFKQLQKQGRSFPALSLSQLEAWLVNQAQERGGSLDKAAARMLVERVGFDRWRLSSELDKLLLAGSAITAATVAAAVPEASSAEIFSMLDALSRGQRQQAIRSVCVLLEQGEGEFYILSMLAYQFRSLLAIRRGIDAGLSQAAIAREHKLKPFVVQKNYAHAQRFSQAYLRGALTRILATDFAIRRGQVDQRTAVLMLVLNLVPASQPTRG